MDRQPAGCLLGFLANLFGTPTQSSDAPPAVLPNKYFISNAERAFFHVLRQVVGTRGHILAQVSLRQLLYFPPAQNRQVWLNRAAQRSLDFVICHPATLQPVVAIELDDATHARPHRQTRDDQVETLMRAAGIPLLHVLTSRTYNVAELAATILPYLNT